MGVSTTRRGEYAKSRARREAILTAAMEVFADSGFRSGSLRDVADRAGMSQAGLMHHFATKNDLLLAVLTRRDELATPLVAAGRQDSGTQMLRAFVDLVERNANTPGLVALFAVLSAEATSSEHPAHAYFLRRSSEVYELILDGFKAAERSGDLLPGVDPAGAARRLVALSDGLQIQWLYDPNVDMAGEVRAYLAPLLTRAL